jgi:hypothetical protein
MEYNIHEKPIDGLPYKSSITRSVKMSTVITREQGYAGFSPEIIRIVTTSTLAQVQTPGWYNNSPIAGERISSVDQCQICYAYASSAQATAIFNVAVSSTGIVTLSVAETSVVLPTIANHIATYTNISGTLSEDPATAISGGNIQAGLSGTAGYLASFPATALKGSFVFKAVANTGNTVTTFSNDAMGQTTTVNVPDPANAIGQLLIGATATPFTTGNFPQNSGTAGLMVDSGLAVSNVVSKVAANTFTGVGSIILPKVNGTESGNAVTASGVAGVITTSSLSTAGGGTYAITWTNTVMTATSVVGLTIQGGTNTTQNINFKVVPGSGSATLTIYNLTAATALNGTIFIGYTVF